MDRGKKICREGEEELAEVGREIGMVGREMEGMRREGERGVWEGAKWRRARYIINV